MPRRGGVSHHPRRPLTAGLWWVRASGCLLSPAGAGHPTRYKNDITLIDAWQEASWAGYGRGCLRCRVLLWPRLGQAAPFDAVLAEQGMKVLDFVAELANLLGKGWQVRVRGGPLLLARAAARAGPFPGRAATRPAHSPGRRRQRACRAVPARSADPARRCPARSRCAARQPIAASRSHRGGKRSPAAADVPACFRSRGRFYLARAARAAARSLPLRTLFKSAPSLTSTCAATPSPSRSRPSKMCSVPM